MRRRSGILSRLSSRHTSAGFTLSELAIVLGVVSIIMGAVWAAAHSVDGSQKVNQSVKEILTISQGTRTLLGNKNKLDPAMIGAEITPFIIHNGIIPSDMAIQTTTDPYHGTLGRPTTPWGSYMSIYGAANGDPQSFRVSLYNLPKGICVELLSAVGTQTGFGAPIGIGSWFTNKSGGAYGSANYIVLPKTPPFSPGDAGVLCNGTAGDISSDYHVSAEFDFSIH